jgi:AcrR family transcriptional regulator
MSASDATRSRANARREREREIVAATRRVFDERGIQDAPIEEIAKGVGINKALIYRHFASKEELYFAAATDYLRELRRTLDEDSALTTGPALERLTNVWSRFIDFCLRYPAFLDCTLSLMRRPSAELADAVSEVVWLRIGQGMGALLGPLAAILADGAEQGVFDVEDPDYMASQLYTQTLGALHLARIGIGVRGGAEGGGAQPFEIGVEQVREGCLRATLATVVKT